MFKPFQIVGFFLIGILFNSCHSIKKSDSKTSYLESSFSGTYVSKPSKTQGENHLAVNILDLFKIYDVEPDSVQMSLENSDKIHLKIFTKKGNEYSTFFEGKLNKRLGYFEIYHHKRRKEIPPLIPIFYSSVYINKIQIHPIWKGYMKIVEYHESSSNIFLMAGGYNFENVYFFKSP